MTSLRDLFDQLRELGPDERARRLDRSGLDAAQRAQLQAMLARETAERTLLDFPVAAAIERLRDDDDQLLHRLIGTRIGSFRLIELVGEGGSSVVFRAERPAGLGAQVVALKLLQQGLASAESRRRFMREQAILARLSHPDIARLVEAGVSDTGIPYIAMEYIEGRPIDRHLDGARLDLAARLRWFVRLCHAVDAAHAALVVHCDLKPANVVVDAQGAMKILDFGVAQLLGQMATTERERAMTPEYAAPEQLRGDPPGVAVDVHALGVMLAELVTGRRLRADDVPPSQASRGAAPEDSRPGMIGGDRLARRLRGDFDAIVARALDPAPASRYRSAFALAQDVERFLSFQPVSARAASWWRASALFVRRHRLSMIAGALLGLALAVNGVVAWQQAKSAREALARAETMREFLLTAFGEATPGGPGQEAATVVDAVERALVKLEDPDEADSVATLELRIHLGDVLMRQGEHERASAVLGDAHERIAALLSSRHELAFLAEQLAAKNAALDGEWATARVVLDRLIAAVPEEMTQMRIDVLTTSTWLSGLAHEPDRGPQEAREVLRLARKLGESGRVAAAQRALGTVLLAHGDGAGAVAVYRELLAQQRARDGDVHSRVAAVEAALSRAYRIAGDLDAAEVHARRAVEIGRQVFPNDHWHKGLHLNALYMVLKEQRRFDEALAVNQEVQRISEAGLPADHPTQRQTYSSFANLYGSLGRWEEALHWSERSMQAYRRTGSETEWEGLRAAITDAYVRGMALGSDEGERCFSRTASLFDLRTDPNIVAAWHERRARLLLDVGDARAARAVLDAMPQARVDAIWAVRTDLQRAELLVADGHWSDAVRKLRASVVSTAALRPADPVASTHAALLLAFALAQQAGGTLAADQARAAAATSWVALRHPPAHLAKLADALGLSHPHNEPGTPVSNQAAGSRMHGSRSDHSKPSSKEVPKITAVAPASTRPGASIWLRNGAPRARSA